MNKIPRIALVGSINHDLVAQVPSIPRPGETLSGTAFAEIAGGKGANQAVAAARAGGQVTMIGRVGRDSFGPTLRLNLDREQIDTTHVLETDGSSGVALIAVDRAGENSIIVVAGANGQLTANDVEAAAESIRKSDLLMLQLEIPIDSVLTAMEIARQAGVLIMLDPAPAPNGYPPELLHVDLACPNETEAASLTGIEVSDDASAFAAADRLRELGVRQALITRGTQGVTVVTDRLRDVVPAIAITAVDTTAAGDAFAGALAVELSAGHDLLAATRFASIAGALAASKAGAQPSLPTRSEVTARLAAE